MNSSFVETYATNVFLQKKIAIENDLALKKALNGNYVLDTFNQCLSTSLFSTF